MGTVERTSEMLVSGLIVMTVLLGASGMHMKPPISKAVCDNPAFLIERETGWCYMPGVKGPCRAGEVFVASGEGNIGECKNKRQVIIPLGKSSCSHLFHLLDKETGLCHRAESQGPCRPGELFIPSEEEAGVGECKNMRQIIIPLFPYRYFYFI